MVKKKTVEETYIKTDLHAHILSLPDSYIGSTKIVCEDQFIIKNDTDKKQSTIIKKTIEFNPGLIKIFDELLVNAIDHTVRESTCNTIKVSIDKNTGSISVFNNGLGIPIVKHAEHLIYVPELMFGNLLTSTNYDKNEEKIVGGKNGYGGKLCNIYSKKFNITVYDSERKLKYSQDYSNNMYDKTEPIITKSSKPSSLCVTFIPDLSRFNMKKLTDDTISLMEKRVYDCTACTGKNVSVYLNDNKIKEKEFKSYIQLYNTQKPLAYEMFEQGQIIWEVSVALSENYSQVSFANGISTVKGGRHVDHVTKQIVDKMSELISSKKKITGIKPSYIKERLFVFVRATIVNPSFDGQTKETLTTHVSKFGIKIDISDAFIQKIYKSGIVEDIISFTNYKNKRELGKNDLNTSRKSKITGIPKLDDAKFAGTKQSKDCTLFIVEGDSAKTLAVSGLSVVGNDYYGIYPIRGKLLNIRKATQSQLLNNKEITDLKTILGLQSGKKYTDASSLRYSHVQILTDADLDGFHISGLIMNMFSHWWPELLEIKGFLQNMKTPIIKVTKGAKEEIDFYTVHDYHEWEKTKTSLKSYKIKYYKGLGTSNSSEAKKMFKNIDKNTSNYNSVSKIDTEEHFDMAFGEKQESARKDWISNFDPNNVLDQSLSDVTYSDFVDNTLVQFSTADNHRSIARLVDGLKPGQRQVMFTVLEKIPKGELKVVQLAGSILEHTHYDHGETSLHGTIVNLAHNYTGSNNWNLLKPNGQFGSRLQNGKDQASPRYIFTELSDISNDLFNETDRHIVDYIKKEGKMVEPYFYVPILPIVLINGTEGIGTGYSTKVPSFNPDDIIANIKRYLDGHPFVEMLPWYSGFKGKIKKIKDGSYNIYGTFVKVTENSIRITELPIGVSTENYKQFLEDTIDKKTYGISDYDHSCTETDIDFLLKFDSKNLLDKFLDKPKSELYKLLKLVTPLSSRNMHLHDTFGKLKKYSSAEEILEEFITIRLQYNTKRKEYLINKLNTELPELENKIRFLTEIIDNDLVIYKKGKKKIEELLSSRNYIKDSKNTFNYLLDMPIHSFTSEKIEDLKSKISKIEVDLKIIKSKTKNDMLIEDISKFEN
jgi:DNA topoisomerase-2